AGQREPRGLGDVVRPIHCPGRAGWAGLEASDGEPRRVLARAPVDLRFALMHQPVRPLAGQVAEHAVEVRVNDHFHTQLPWSGGGGGNRNLAAARYSSDMRSAAICLAEPPVPMTAGASSCTTSR